MATLWRPGLCYSSERQNRSSRAISRSSIPRGYGIRLRGNSRRRSGGSHFHAPVRADRLGEHRGVGFHR